MHVEHVAVVLLGCVLECWQNHRRPIVLDEIAKCTDGLRSCLATVDPPQPLRQNLQSQAACRKFGNGPDHFGPSQSAERAVCLNYILPPACHPKLSPSAALEKRSLLETPSSHRFSLPWDLDGPPSLSFVASQCSPHVKPLRDLSSGAAPRPLLRLRGNANTSQGG